MKIWVSLRWFFLLLLLAACAKTASPVSVTEIPSPQGPPPTESPDSQIDISSLSGRILFSAEGDIFVINADGTGRTQITDHPAEDFDPVWSPDGTQIAFRTHRDGDEEVYLMNADGSDPRNLSNAPNRGDYSPAWSPNGEWVAFMSDRAGNNNIWVIRPDGSDLRQVTDIPGISEYPTWAPDGSRIAFTCTFGRRLSTGSGDFEICVVNFDGTGLIQLTDTPGSNKLPAWSPDGTRLAFESDRDGWPTLPDYVPLGYDPGDFGDSEIYIMNVDGSGQINLTNHPREGDTFPAWSRDGYLVISRYGCLIIMRDDGSGSAPLGSCLDGGHFPDWYQPVATPVSELEPADRCLVAFVDERNQQVDIYTILSDGTQLNQLTEDAAQERWPVWSPDGTQIVYQKYEDDRSIPEIFGVSSNGEGQVNLTNHSGDDWSPAWSPDGSQIVFRKELPGNDEIFIINADGTNPRSIGIDPIPGQFADWGPCAK